MGLQIRDCRHVQGNPLVLYLCCRYPWLVTLSSLKGAILSPQILALSQYSFSSQIFSHPHSLGSYRILLDFTSSSLSAIAWQQAVYFLAHQVPITRPTWKTIHKTPMGVVVALLMFPRILQWACKCLSLIYNYTTCKMKTWAVTAVMPWPADVGETDNPNLQIRGA